MHLVFTRNPMVPISNVFFSFSSGHQVKSSRLKDNFQSQISMTPSSNHWILSFTVFLQGDTSNSFSRDIHEAVPKQFVNIVNSPSIHLGNQIHSIQSGFVKTFISIINHGNIIQPSSLLNLARYTFHQTVNTASSIQYRPAASMKESIS
ncbi:hypothetical protein O181_059845 [Austropuccinia psidii MF-1]|uniref:Uncharacterized protein n=1 Tax=Austropuccinia psidii MF-1 TaxID=1389203 RepID=A0A9Q3EJ86_9BASI|nr:hypothetical protein [Austropuccinia psidii MF-1]